MTSWSRTFLLIIASVLVSWSQWSYSIPVDEELRDKALTALDFDAEAFLQQRLLAANERQQQSIYYTLNQDALTNLKTISLTTFKVGLDGKRVESGLLRFVLLGSYLQLLTASQPATLQLHLLFSQNETTAQQSSDQFQIEASLSLFEKGKEEWSLPWSGCSFQRYFIEESQSFSDITAMCDWSIHQESVGYQVFYQQITMGIDSSRIEVKLREGSNPQVVEGFPLLPLSSSFQPLYHQSPIISKETSASSPMFRICACSGLLSNVDEMEKKWPGLLRQWIVHHSIAHEIAYLNIYDSDGSALTYLRPFIKLGFVRYFPYFGQHTELRQVSSIRMSSLVLNHCLYANRPYTALLLELPNPSYFACDEYYGEETFELMTKRMLREGYPLGEVFVVPHRSRSLVPRPHHIAEAYPFYDTNQVLHHLRVICNNMVIMFHEGTSILHVEEKVMSLQGVVLHHYPNFLDTDYVFFADNSYIIESTMIHLNAWITVNEMLLSLLLEGREYFELKQELFSPLPSPLPPNVVDLSSLRINVLFHYKDRDTLPDIMEYMSIILDALMSNWKHQVLVFPYRNEKELWRTMLSHPFSDIVIALDILSVDTAKKLLGHTVTLLQFVDNIPQGQVQDWLLDHYIFLRDHRDIRLASFNPTYEKLASALEMEEVNLLHVQAGVVVPSQEIQLEIQSTSQDVDVLFVGDIMTMSNDEYDLLLGAMVKENISFAHVTSSMFSGKFGDVIQAEELDNCRVVVLLDPQIISMNVLLEVIARGLTIIRTSSNTHADYFYSNRSFLLEEKSVVTTVEKEGTLDAIQHHLLNHQSLQQQGWQFIASNHLLTNFTTSLFNVICEVIVNSINDNLNRIQSITTEPIPSSSAVQNIKNNAYLVAIVTIDQPQTDFFQKLINFIEFHKLVGVEYFIVYLSSQCKLHDEMDSDWKRTEQLLSFYRTEGLVEWHVVENEFPQVCPSDLTWTPICWKRMMQEAIVKSKTLSEAVWLTSLSPQDFIYADNASTYAVLVRNSLKFELMELAARHIDTIEVSLRTASSRQITIVQLRNSVLLGFNVTSKNFVLPKYLDQNNIDVSPKHIYTFQCNSEERVSSNLLECLPLAADFLVSTLTHNLKLISEVMSSQSDNASVPQVDVCWKSPYIFMTFFRDIHRHQWNVRQRNVNTYLDNLLNLLKDFKEYPFVIYLDPVHFPYLQARLSTHTNIIYKSLFDVKDTFFDSFQHKHNQSMESSQFKSIFHYQPTRVEQMYSLYNSVTNSKINYVRHTKDLYPGCSHYFFVDFNFGRDFPADIPQRINPWHLSPKILINSLSIISHKFPVTREELIRDELVFVDGSSYAIPNGLVNWFEESWRQELEDYDTRGLADDDQSVLYYIMLRHPTQFIGLRDNRWFGLYKSYLNSPFHVQVRAHKPYYVHFTNPRQ